MSCVFRLLTSSSSLSEEEEEQEDEEEEEELSSEELDFWKTFVGQQLVVVFILVSASPVLHDCHLSINWHRLQ